MNEEGQLSLDLLAGFTIFLLGLIMAASMVPGLLIGLRRTTAIDYDAVAYRTGAILVEDPGCAIRGDYCLERDWENLDINNSGGRLGLAMEKGHQNILSPYKIAMFNDNEYLKYPDSYRNLMIFGDYPYQFNITLIDENYFSNENKLPRISVGDPVPESANYGYIKRIVKIKGDTRFDIDLTSTSCLTNKPCNATCFNCSDVTQTFTVGIDLKEIKNSTQFIDPLFRFDPLAEPIQITLTNLRTKFNWSNDDDPPHERGFFNGSALWNPPAAANWSMWNETGYQPERATFYATLETIKFWYPDEYNSRTNLPYTQDQNIILNITNWTNPNAPISNKTIIDMLIPVRHSMYQNDTLSLTINPIFTRNAEGSTLYIEFIFKDDPPRTLINGTYMLNLNLAEGIVRNNVSKGWLEVAVW